MKWPWTKVKVRDSVIIFVEFITWISPISERVFFNTQTRVHTHRLFYLKMEYTKRSRHTHEKKIAPKIRSISLGKLKHTLRWMCLWTTTEIIIYYSNNHRRYSHITPQVYFGNVKAADIQPNMFYLPACLWADGCVLFSISRIIK